MESRLQSLIDKIKTDGIAEAEKQAKTILADAEQKASRIVREATSQAEQVMDRAKQDAARAEEAGKKALEQAGRNLVLSVEKNLTDLFHRILKDEVKSALTPEIVGGILEKIISRWDPEKGVEIELGKEDEQVLVKGLIGNLQQKARKGLVLRPVETIDAGFTIGEKNGNVYYDFTHGGIAEILAQYLNPNLAEILRTGIG